MQHSPDPMDRSGFVQISDVIPDVLLDIRYYSTYNFTGDRVDGYEFPTALLSKEAVQALRRVNEAAKAAGYRLKIFDAYRPQAAVDHFVRWATDADDLRMKPYFYPDVDKSKLFDLGFIARRSGHSRGSTVDLTLFDMGLGQDADMGGPFDYFGDLSHSDYEGITPRQMENRLLLRRMMTESGFGPIRSEWWHFTLQDEPWPDTYFAFPVRP